MSNKKRTIKNETIQKRSVSNLVQIAETRINSKFRTIEKTRKFGLAELKKKTGISEHTLLRFVDVGILHPKEGQKGEMSVHDFTYQDLVNAEFANVFKEADYRPKEIAPLIELWNESSSRADGSNLFGGNPSYEMPLNQLIRAQMMILSRLLATEAALICGISETPRNSVVIARKLNDIEVNWAMLYKTYPAAIDDVAAIISEETNEIIKGICTSNGEMVVGGYETQDLIESLEGRRFFKVHISDNSEKQIFEIIIGFPKGEGFDIDTIDQRLNNDRLDFLIQLLRFTFNYVLHLDTLMSEASIIGIRSKTEIDVLRVLAELITFIAPRKWSYCGILIPRHSSSLLSVAAWSSEFPHTLQGEVLGISSAEDLAAMSLPVWVYKNGESTAINSVVDNDLRIPQAERERIKAAVAVPATVGGMVSGVVYVASREWDDATVNCFEHNDVKLLKILGHIVGEVIERNNCAVKCTHGILKLIPEKPSVSQQLDELQRDMISAVDNIFQVKDSPNSLNSLVVLTIGIDGIFEVASRQNQVATWISEKVQEKTYKFFEEKLRYDLNKSNPLRVYKLGVEQYVVLLARTRENHRKLRMELENELSSLHGFGTKHDQIKIDVWSLNFAYQDLFNRIESQDYDQAALSMDLLNRIKSSLKVLLNIRRGNHYLSIGRYDLASVEFEMAHLSEASNPYVQRHLAKCKIILKQYEEATTYAKYAVKEDPNYANSHEVLGDAYFANGNYKKAIEHYEIAKKLNANDPSPHIGYAQALLLDGDLHSIDETLKELTLAMSQDGKEITNVKKYLRLKAEACLLVKDYKRAIRFLEQALGLSPEDRELIFILKLAEKAKKDNRLMSDTNFDASD